MVGTSAARANFNNSTESAALQLEGTDANRRLSITGADHAAVTILARQRSGAVGGNTILQDTDLIGVVRFEGSDGSEFVQAASIEAFVDGTPGANDMPGRLVFSTTADGASFPTERMSIDSSGRVGIGTTSPGGKLHASSGTSGAVISSDADDLIVENSGNCGITIATPNTGIGSIHFADPQNNDSGGISYSHNDESLRFTAFSKERARFDSSGRLLLGVSAPISVGSMGLHVKSPTAPVACIESWNEASSGTIYHIQFRDGPGQASRGSISTNGSATAYNTTSDYRLKENVTPVSDGITRLQQLKPSRFNFIADPGNTVDGFLAHEAQSVVPECATGTKDAVDDDGNP